MLVNLIGFQVAWFSCVLGSANQQPWLGVLVGCLVLAVHLSRCDKPLFEVRLLIAASVIGLIFDGIPKSLGWISFTPVSFWPDVLPPPWMVILWALFASTINVSLNWLKHKNLLAILIGAIAGPVSYWSAVRLGALHFNNFASAMLYLAIGWGIAVPVLLNIACLKDQKSF
ncbi:MAG: DUF2878 domain-containing protein [Candidatus Methylopumilus sp.]